MSSTRPIFVAVSNHAKRVLIDGLGRGRFAQLQCQHEEENELCETIREYSQVTFLAQTQWGRTFLVSYFATAVL